MDEMGLTEHVQPHIGWPYGECVRASYASLLDLPMAAVPRFDPGTRKEPDQTVAERKWLRSRGFDLVIVNTDPNCPPPLIPEDLDHLLFVTTSRGPHGHRVVGRGGKVIWDPYPGGSKVTGIVAYYFVVPRMVRAKPPRAGVPLSDIGLLRLVQPHVGHPYGECVRTSYASMLDLPLSSVPRFDPGTRTEKDQTVAERRWLRSRGLDLVILRAGPGNQPLIPRDFDHLLSLRTKCGNGHRTVGRGGKMIWDPHPGGADVTGLKAYYFVVPAGKPAL